jgi:tetratricopeptide (TPR) repeat protein
MRAFRMSACMLVAALLLAQTDDVNRRLQRALEPSGQSAQGAAALAKKDFAKVEELLAASQASGQAPPAELLALRGIVEFLAGKMQPAATAFDAASRLQPLNDGDAFMLAMALVNLGDDGQARRLLKSLAEKYPQRAIYLYWLGRLDYDQRRYQEAVEKLKTAAAIDPNSSRIWDSLGLAWDMQGQSEQALQAFQKAASLNRKQPHASPWPPHDLGILLLRMNQAGEAETALRESLGYTPALAQSHYYLGRALEKEGRETEAINEYVAAISADAVTPEPCYSLAMLYQKQHHDTEAKAMFTEFKRRKQVASASADSPHRF